ncbi:MAG: lysylphosphatidylglycerol synthase transmembrane domain-containing protein [Planctomycetia bacterium]|nr:lysylphosphatidylglycerol synthase transmembrane domain-containing protein [Planctomycetia bacterium]
MSKKNRKTKQNKKKPQAKTILTDSLNYGIEYGLEDGLENALKDGTKFGIQKGLESFAINAVEEGVGDLLSKEFDKTKDSISSRNSKEQNELQDSNEFQENAEKAISENFDPSKNNQNRLKHWKRFIFLVKLIVVALVLVWIGGRLYQDSNEIMKYDWTIHYRWVILSCLIYLLAFFPASVFWFFLLRWMGQKISFFQAVRAFYVSQLGKYLPGKAMVVIIRSAMVTGEKVRASVAAVCVFYETLTMMATGAFIAAMIILIWFREHWFYSIISIGMMIAASLPVFPVVFIRIMRLFRIGKKDEQLQGYLDRITFRTFLVGFALMTFLWIFFGVSLWAAIQGLGILPGNFIDNLPRYISATALAVVLGFAVPISPGGIGIRETVLSLLLIPYFDAVLMMPENNAIAVQASSLALIVSLEQRIVSIVAELSLVGLFFLIPVIRWFWKKLC